MIPCRAIRLALRCDTALRLRFSFVASRSKRRVLSVFADFEAMLEVHPAMARQPAHDHRGWRGSGGQPRRHSAAMARGSGAAGAVRCCLPIPSCAAPCAERRSDRDHSLPRIYERGIRADPAQPGDERSGLMRAARAADPIGGGMARCAMRRRMVSWRTAPGLGQSRLSSVAAQYAARVVPWLRLAPEHEHLWTPIVVAARPLPAFEGCRWTIPHWRPA